MRRGQIGRKTILLAVVAGAFALRVAYLLHSHPFVDEFTTVLAAKAILERGLPILPSGLFYEHGVLFTYLDAPFVALAGEETWFAIARLPSVLIGTASVAFLYWVGRRWLSARAGLVAAALLAFSPEGMVWGGRARMYALAQLLVLLLAFLVYEGSRGERISSPSFTSRARWLALLVLLMGLLTQLGALVLVPPLLVGALAIGWLTRTPGERPWFLRRAALFEGGALTLTVGLGVLVKRLGRPLGVDPLGNGGAGDLAEELIGTITYQAGLVLDGENALKFVARQFGVPHHLWLTLVAVAGGLFGLAVWLSARKLDGQRSPQAPYTSLYLWLVFGLTVVEMVTLLEPWRRNPRYLVMALPLFYLMVAAGLERIADFKSGDQGIRGSGDQRIGESGNRKIREAGRLRAQLLVLVFGMVQAGLLAPDLRIAYLTPEPAYEEAFQYVADQWQPGDVLLTMNTSAAGLYLKGIKDALPGSMRFAVQEDAEQFLLEAGGERVDRWLGAAWVGTALDFNQVLAEHRRAWFVVDTIRLPVYYRGDWLASVDTQMNQVWSQDNALVYLTRPDRVPLPTHPDVLLDARLGDMIALNGYSLAQKSDNTGHLRSGRCEVQQALCLHPGDHFQITLFWQAQAAVDADYSVFVHLRNAEGVTVAQRDTQPLDGLYPTSQWQLGETVAQPLEFGLPDDLAAGAYAVYVGLYRLDTLTRLPVTGDTSGENAIILDTAIHVAADK
jgi:4-amino-4-deoxy-L-arabinose transferase-like glycosyltransferase